MSENELGEAVRRRAYEIWDREGRPDGRDAEHWERAEAELRAERAAAPDADTKPGAAETPATADASAAGSMAGAGDAEAVLGSGAEGVSPMPPSDESKTAVPPSKRRRTTRAETGSASGEPSQRTRAETDEIVGAKV